MNDWITALLRRLFVRWVDLCSSVSLFAMLLTVSGSVATAASTSPSPIDLSGVWRLQTVRGGDHPERASAGEIPASFEAKIVLPGDLVQRGFGEPVTLETKWTGSLFDTAFFNADAYAPYREPGHIKVPFWLQPERTYAGPAWYQRDVEIPQSWKNFRVVLHLERPHWATQAWLDGKPLGECRSLSTPHEYELGYALEPGTHRLTVRVDNRRIVDVGENSHSISDHTQGNWNGLVGRIELRATPPVWVSSLQAYPSHDPRRVIFKGRVDAIAQHARPAEVVVRSTPAAGASASPSAERQMTVALDAEGNFAGQLDLPADAPLWDEFQPALHRLTAAIPGGDTREVMYGLRTISTAGNQLLLNGRKLFIRGTLECAIFPLTGHPPTDVESWTRLFQVARDHGLNSLRFHSWCPPRAAFVAADTLGFYLQVEAASWPNQSTTLGEGKPVDAWLEEETLRILAEYGNHPSFVLMASSNEPGGDAACNAYLARWLERRKQADNRRLFTSGAGWPQLPENQFHVAPDPRIQQWGAELNSRINAKPPETQTDYRDYIAERAVPVISHEIGQWCVYPDFNEMRQYTGYLKPRNFEIFQDRLKQSGLLGLAREFLLASGKLQVLCYKEDIESALRTPGMGGFQLLGLQDFPGQGTALVGVVNPFWGSKGYVDAETFRRFCNTTVPLARFAKRVFTADETLELEGEVAHFGATPLARVRATWKLRDAAGTTVRSGEFEARDLPVGNGLALGKIQLALADLPVPAKYNLQIDIPDAAASNDWDVWVYPSRTSAPAAEASPVMFTRDMEAALPALEAGRTVLLSLPAESVRAADGPPVKMGFSSVFWNTSWTNRQAPTTLGILCDPQHPALAAFPTEAHSNWQWWYLITRAAPLPLSALPEIKTPIVRVIDDWFTARSLALVIEAHVGRGRLLLTTIDLDAADNPVPAQLRTSLLRYAASPQFRPVDKLAPEALRALLKSQE